MIEFSNRPRMAKCGCGALRPSIDFKNLAFFEYRGKGSTAATESCKNCKYHQNAHRPEVMAKNTALKCTNFEPHGAFEFDVFYCGCRGWD